MATGGNTNEAQKEDVYSTEKQVPGKGSPYDIRATGEAPGFGQVTHDGGEEKL